MQEGVPDLIKQFSRGSNFVSIRYSGYIINRNRFNVRLRDLRHRLQNCGVTLVASTTNFACSKHKNPIPVDFTYYGRILDIVELDYYGYLWSFHLSVIYMRLK